MADESDGRPARNMDVHGKTADLDSARRQVSEYAMAMDLLARITRSDTEKGAIRRIVGLFSALFAPRRLCYVTVRDGKPQMDDAENLPDETLRLVRQLSADPESASAWTASGRGYVLKVTHRAHLVGVLVVDDLAYPQYKERYLNLSLSMVGVCGLAIENARRYQQLKESEHRLRQEKERVEAALAKVKKLSGLLPICSHCKKIRDDRGYWNQIENYILEHSDAEFSHSICKECADAFYPDLDLYDE